MPQAATITVNDREATPVAHNFTPDSQKDQVWLFREVTGTPVGENTLTVSSKRSSGKIRVKALLKCPIVATETVNGVSAPVVARTAYVELNLTFDEKSTLQERKNTVGLMYNAMASTQGVLNPVFTEVAGLY